MTTKSITPATKYRVAIRDIAIAHGWSFEQLDNDPRVDRFIKGKTVVDVTHGPSNLITAAEVLVGDKVLKSVAKSGKMYQVQEILTGVEDPDHTRHIRLQREQVAKYESGQGIAKIKSEAAPASAPVPAPKQAAAPKRRAPAKKTAPVSA